MIRIRTNLDTWVKADQIGVKHHVLLVRRGKQTANPRLTRWIQRLLEEGLVPLIEIVAEHLSKDEALDMEEMLIARHGRRHIDPDGILLNIAKRGTKYDRSGENNPMYGKKLSAEACEKIGASKRGKKRGEAFSQTMREVALARPKMTKETTEKRIASRRAKQDGLIVTSPSGEVTTYALVTDFIPPPPLKSSAMVYASLQRGGDGRGSLKGWHFARSTLKTRGN